METSSGTGTAGGIDGKGGRAGAGRGRRVRAGQRRNTGGGDRNEGRRWPGRRGGTDYNKTVRAEGRYEKAVLLSKPEPGFTEEARKNNVMGTVKLRLVLCGVGCGDERGGGEGVADGVDGEGDSGGEADRFQPGRRTGGRFRSTPSSSTPSHLLGLIRFRAEPSARFSF